MDEIFKDRFAIINIKLFLTCRRHLIEMFPLFTMDNAKELEANRPLAQALTAEDYNPDSSSLPTYLRYFWQGGLSATVLILLLSLLGNPTLFLGYWWSQSMAVCSEKLVVFPSNASNVNQSQSSSCPWYSKLEILWQLD